ncbi:MAG: tetrahydrofolate dehydrogenase/cyclohydrolase catalytic domain-containing protein, partial [bacterium]
MSAKLINGKAIAARIREEIQVEVQRLKNETGVTPGLTAVLVGDDAASRSYVRSKRKACLEIGMNSDVLELPAQTTQKELEAIVDRLNADRAVHGILIQLPLPDHIQETPILERVDPKKDVDGFHPISVGKLALGMETFVPCTPLGVRELLLRSGIDPSGKVAVIVGRSNIVG